MTRRTRPWGAAVVVLLLTGSCADVEARVLPGCEDVERLAIIAQSVPDASYVPCLATLPAGWTFEGLAVSDTGTEIHLESDRSDRGVRIELRDRCDASAATPIAPRDEGVRTYQAVDSIDPRVAGRVLDVFPGGCVVTTYDFERGRHVPLVAELGQVVGLRSRIELRQEVQQRLGVTLDP